MDIGHIQFANGYWQQAMQRVQGKDDKNEQQGRQQRHSYENERHYEADEDSEYQIDEYV